MRFVRNKGSERHTWCRLLWEGA